MTSRQEFLTMARRWVDQESAWSDWLPGNRATVAAPKPVSAEQAASSVPAASKAAALQALYDRYKGCTRCPLGATRIQFVFGVGDPEASVLFIGEGPGYEEDRRGEPFVGKAGQLLDKIMAAIGLNRQNAYIANIVKCHPMQNPETPEARGNDRAPNAIEVETCSPILKQQIAIIQPKVIVTLGSPSSRTLLQTTDGITRLRGRFFPFPVDSFYRNEGSLLAEDSALAPSPTIDTATRQALSRARVLPTYHPAALLRNPDLKKDVWMDMKLLRDALQKDLF